LPDIYIDNIQQNNNTTMTSIQTFNAQQFYSYILEKYQNIRNASQYTKNQIKLCIFLHFKDTPESKTNPLFYTTDKLKSIFDKYIRFIHAETTGCIQLVDANSEYMYITIGGEDGDGDGESNENDPVAKFQSLDITKKRKSYKWRQETRREEEMRSADYESTAEFIAYFMKPYKKVENPISIRIYETMRRVVDYEEQRVKSVKRLKKTELSGKLFQISTYQNEMLVRTISSHPPKSTLDKTVESLDNLKESLFRYTNEIHLLYDSYKVASKLAGEEKHYYFQREYCKKTVLLSVNTLKQTLNEDTMNYIKSFIDPTFLENIRRHAIKEKHYAFPRQKVSDLLNKLTVKQLHRLCESNIPLMYDLTQFPEDDEINAIRESVPFMGHFMLAACHPIYSSYIMSINKKKRIIGHILENIATINNFEFQRELFFLAKNKNKKTEQPIRRSPRISAESYACV
jgi:hypothetical protein